MTGTMEAIYFGNKTAYWKHQPDPSVAASGGFIMADYEKVRLCLPSHAAYVISGDLLLDCQGMYGGNDTSLNPDNTPIQADYVTAMLKGKTGNFVLKGGDAGAAVSPSPLTIVNAYGSEEAVVFKTRT